MLAVNHHEKDSRQILFIANQDASRRRDLAVRAKWPAKNAELWDPMQGTVERPVVENGLVKVSLEPSQAVFLVWPNVADATSASLPLRVENPKGETIPVSVTENVTQVVPDSKGATKVTLSPYSESVATECKFTLPALAKDERVFFVCDGSEGESSAAVTVNGAFAGGFIGAPYRLDITAAVKPGENTLVAKPFRILNPRIIIVKP